jgi:hypothetical protein
MTDELLVALVQARNLSPTSGQSATIHTLEIRGCSGVTLKTVDWLKDHVPEVQFPPPQFLDDFSLY